MKKLIYEPKNFRVNNSNTKETSKEFNVSIVSGPVGDTYGFIKSDTTTITVKDFEGKTMSVIESEIAAGVADFVQTKYPPVEVK